MCSSPAPSSHLGAGFGNSPGSRGERPGRGQRVGAAEGLGAGRHRGGGGEAGRMRWERQEAENNKFSQGQQFIPKQPREWGSGLVVCPACPF